MFNRILVICTGNICRSPIAEALLAQALPKCTVTSAGTGAMVGWGADPHSVTVCAAHEVALASHRARQVTEAMMQSNDLVLALDAGHMAALNARFPQYRGKVHKLGKWQNNTDVPDPYGAPLPVFEACYAQVTTMVADWVKRL